MRSAFNTDILRSITGSWGRFLAIVGIVALGCGFYAGLRMTAPDMDGAADAYYDETSLMDIRVVSTLGLTDADLEALRQVDGVEEVEGAFETDAMVTLNDEQYAVRIHSMPYEARGSDRMDESMVMVPEMDAGALNELLLVEGRWPTASDECIISADNVMNSPVSLGDGISVDEGVQDLDGILRERTFKVVGFAHSPYYVSTTAMGSTALGSGTIEQFMYVPANAFSSDLPFTEAFIKVEGAKGELAGSMAYQARVDGVVKELEGISSDREDARLAEVKAEAQRTLEENRQEYLAGRADAEAQLNEAQQKLDDASAEIESSRAKIASGQGEYDSGVQQLVRERASAERQLADAEEQLNERQAQLDASGAQLEGSAARLEAGWAAAGLTAATAPAAAEGLKAQLAALDPTAPDYAERASALQAQIAQIETLMQSQAALDAGWAQHDAASAQIAAGRQELAVQRQEIQAQLAAAQRKLDAVKAQLQSARAQLADGEAERRDGQAEYDAEHARAQDEFADAERKLAEAQAKIEDIKKPEWLIMDRTKNPGVVSFESDADRVDSIASFFPFIFFLVAALVALTTMTRMVEEERVLIGTFKALGYSRARITSKYLIYAAVASVAGAVIGVVAMALILPPIIMEAYAIIYSVPHGILMPIDPCIALSAAGLGVGVTLIATWAAVASTLRESPAQLMLPRAPKQGKRILLERIGPLWRHLSFSWKVTCRNIFRYKKRLVMTVIGIAGCTGLLLTGLGLSDAVNDIIDKQYGETVLYNVIVDGDDDLSDDSRDELVSLAETHAFAQVDTMMASGPERSDASVSVVTPEDAQEFQKLWAMRTRVGHEPLSLGGDGVIITEKLANLLGLAVGDNLTLAEQDSMGNATNTTYGLKVTGIMENYVANYVFLGTDVYADTFGNAPDAKTMYAEVPDGEGEHQAFRDAAAQIPGVKTVAFNNEVISTYRSMLKSVNMIVVVLVVAAAALAFIVLYNLTNINITERVREIATLKVLGFTPHEVDMYIYRETIILTVLGALIGLIFGVVLEGFVIVTAEVDYVMFGRDIHLLSFVMAFAVTILFAVVVMLTMRRKLANINMIESLKSIE